MITEQKLQEAIAECNGERNPNANTCLKLASFYTILDHIKGSEPRMPTYSYSDSPKYKSNTEFWEAAESVSEYDLFKIIDELMSTLRIVNPRLYTSVIRKLEDGK